MIGEYESEPDAIRYALPEPLEPEGSNREIITILR
jgi:hypothetical protein